MKTKLGYVNEKLTLQRPYNTFWPTWVKNSIVLWYNLWAPLSRQERIFWKFPNIGDWVSGTLFFSIHFIIKCESFLVEMFKCCHWVVSFISIFFLTTIFFPIIITSQQEQHDKHCALAPKVLSFLTFFKVILPRNDSHHYTRMNISVHQMPLTNCHNESLV